MTYPLNDETLQEIWKHHRNDVEATRVPGSPGFGQAQIDRRILLNAYERLLLQMRKMDQDLIDAEGRLQDLT